METTSQSMPAHRLRTIFIGLAAGFASGVLSAVVARALMRMIALITSGSGSFSIEGTAFIFMFGALAGALFGLLYRLTFHKIRTHTLVKGLLFGLVLAVAIQLPGLQIAPDFAAELMVVGPLGFAVFVVMNFTYVLSLAAVDAWLEKNWPQDDSRRKVELGLTIILGLIALAGLGLLGYEIGGRILGLVK